MGRMLGDSPMRGLIAGETRADDVELRLRLPPRPLGFLLVFVRGATEGDAIVEGPELGIRGSNAGVARVLEGAFARIRGVAEPNVVSMGGPAASGRCSSSIPRPKLSVAGLGGSSPAGDGFKLALADCCFDDKRIRDAGVAGGCPFDELERSWGSIEGVFLTDVGFGGGLIASPGCGEVDDGYDPIKSADAG